MPLRLGILQRSYLGLVGTSAACSCPCSAGYTLSQDNAFVAGIGDRVTCFTLHFLAFLSSGYTVFPEKTCFLEQVIHYSYFLSLLE